MNETFVLTVGQGCECGLNAKNVNCTYFQRTWSSCIFLPLLNHFKAGTNRDKPSRIVQKFTLQTVHLLNRTSIVHFLRVVLESNFTQKTTNFQKISNYLRNLSPNVKNDLNWWISRNHIPLQNRYVTQKDIKIII